MVNVFRVMGVFLVALTCVSCVAGAKLRANAGQIQNKVQLARERGAYNCAPMELAKAESHLEFLRDELDFGDVMRADWHHRVALENISHALDITDPDTCLDKVVVFDEPEPVVIKEVDRDKDGILDTEDQCPDEPEDLDNFEDEHGCPDPDNDGDTVLDTVDLCPLVPGDAANKGCPNPDRDGDGVQNSVDKCPDDAEDRDLFEDEDGCPDPDNDADSVLDVDDQCPLQPGLVEHGGCPVMDRDSDGVSDNVDLCPDVPGTPPNGCPARVLVKVTETHIEIKEHINFETAKAVIKGELSFQIIDQVGSVLKSKPKLNIVIEGHTDSVGAADYNLQLSDDRANAVREALIERGIAPERMEAIGYGESRPVGWNQTKEGRAANRRVEFRIVK